MRTLGMKDLFGSEPYQPPAQRHSVTSIAAAESIKDKIGPLHARILAYLRTHGPATDEEMQRDLSMGANTQRPRRRELQLMDRIRDSGDTRRCQSGREAAVWRIVV